MVMASVGDTENADFDEHCHVHSSWYSFRLNLEMARPAGVGLS